MTVFFRQGEILKRQKLHTDALLRSMQIQSTFAKTLLAKIEENRKQRLQTERIERRKRKEASYNRRRNRGHRRNKKSKNGN